MWALDQAGFRAVIAPSFADIFYNNSFKSGFLPLVLSDAQLDQLFAEQAEEEGYALTIDLPEQLVVTPSGDRMHFEIDEFRKNCLIRGLDEIGLTLQRAEDIKAYEAKRAEQAPWLFAS